MKGKKLENALKWIIPLLEKHEIPFQISGGFAAFLYGVNRPIQDIDIDLPDERMEELLPEIQPYIIFGPERYKDENWDLKLITLNYHDQEIDLAGMSAAKIFNQSLQRWQLQEVNLSSSKKILFHDALIPVIEKEDLINYKTKLSREVDLIDVKRLMEG